MTCVYTNERMTRAISGSQDKRIKIWDLDRGECTQTLEGHQRPIQCVRMNAEETEAISVSSQEIKIWNLRTSQCIRTSVCDDDDTIRLHISDKMKVIKSFPDQTIKICDADSGECLQTLHQGNRIVCLQMYADETRAISGSNIGTIKIWDLDAGRILQTLQGHGDWVESIYVNRDKTKAISGSLDRTIKIWNLAPLPEELISDVARAYLQDDPASEEKLESLPLFVQSTVAHLQDNRAKAIALNQYIAENFFPRIVKLYRDGEILSATRRLARLPDLAQQSLQIFPQRDFSRKT